MTRPPRTEIDWRQVHERLEHAGRALGQTGLAADAARLLLERRAADLAEPLPEAAAPVEALELLVFPRGEETYALEARHVVEVFPLPDVTPVPFTPPSVLGVVNHRGRILPVIDVARLLGPASEEAEPSLVIAVEAGEAAFGIGADAVPELISVGASELVRATELAEQPDSAVRGLTAEMAAVLDLDVLARDPRIEVDDEIE